MNIYAFEQKCECKFMLVVLGEGMKSIKLWGIGFLE